MEVNDAMHADFRQLAPVEEDSAHWRCLNVNLPVVIDAAGEAGASLTCLPLFAGNDSAELGVVELQSAARLSDQDMAIIERVLRVYRNMHSMFMYSECDALTGLLNRKSFEETFYKSLGEDLKRVKDEPVIEASDGDVLPRRRAKPGERFWLAMVDVDHFKQVNDQYGHQIGDEVLILVARILKSTLRGYDRVYRFGGEEFVILLRCPDHGAAVKTIERVRQKMAQYRFPQVGRITVSIGLSDIQAGDAPGVVCSRADQAVYYAKRNGRNRVCSYGELVAQRLIETDVRDGGVELF